MFNSYLVHVLRLGNYEKNAKNIQELLDLLQIDKLNQNSSQFTYFLVSIEIQNIEFKKFHLIFQNGTVNVTLQMPLTLKMNNNQQEILSTSLQNCRLYSNLGK